MPQQKNSLIPTVVAVVELRSIALTHSQTETKQRDTKLTWFEEKKFSYIHEW